MERERKRSDGASAIGQQETSENFVVQCPQASVQLNRGDKRGEWKKRFHRVITQPKLLFACGGRPTGLLAIPVVVVVVVVVVKGGRHF